VFFECCGEMGNGGVAQHDGNFGDAEAFFVEQVAGVFHALALVEVEDRRSEHLFKPFFQVTFVDGDLAAELLDSERFADMLQEDLAGLDDLIAIGFVGEELALEAFHFFFSDHTFQAIKQEHLALGVDKDVLQAVGIAVIQQGFEDKTGPSAEGKGLGEGSRMSEFQQVVADGVVGFAGPDRQRASYLGADELGKVNGKKAEAKHVYGVDAFGAAGGGVELTGITFEFFFSAIDPTGEAET